MTERNDADKRHDIADGVSSDAVETSNKRRRFLVTAATATGVVGAGLAAWPFVASLQPSQRARSVGGAVQVDLSGIAPGEQVTVTWRGNPIWVLRRTIEMLEGLAHPHWVSELRDPNSTEAAQQPPYAQNGTRSLRPDIFVAVALCTHLGCVPTFRPETRAPGMGEDWMGGYFCPCHGSKFDLAGRVTRNVPAPTNLVIPPHRFLSANRLEIGVDDA